MASPARQRHPVKMQLRDSLWHTAKYVQKVCKWESHTFRAALQSSPCRLCSCLGTRRLLGCRGVHTRRQLLLLCPCRHARAARGLLLIRTVISACAVLMLRLGWVDALLRCRCVWLCCFYASAWGLVSCCRHASSIRLQQYCTSVKATVIQSIGQQLNTGSHVTQSPSSTQPCRIDRVTCAFDHHVWEAKAGAAML